MKHDYVLADVFTDRLFGGNQLAVFLDGDQLTSAQMQAVAAEINLSETAFLGARKGPDESWPLRIFTPKIELPFAGHPTVGTALAMAWTGLIRPKEAVTTVEFQEGIGPVKVRVTWCDGAPRSATLSVAGPSKTGPTPDTDQVAAILGLRAEEVGFPRVLDRLGVRTLSMGVPFTLVPLVNRSALARAQLDLSKWQNHLAETWAPHLYLFTADAESPGADFRARMFAPAMGIPEDPATGAAASALASYLAAVSGTIQGTGAWVIEQGIEMGRPSRLEIGATWSGGEVTVVEVGGGAVQVGSGSIRVPDSA
ncbi:MAG: PhzF family phenazine biosynthesis protein [Pseudomonadota bacterium]